MKICVLMKQVPDKNASLKIAADNCSLINENITLTCNESDNYALEEALLIKEQYGGEVVACTLGQQTAPQILKDAMAKGADRSIFIPNTNNVELDVLSIAKIILRASSVMMRCQAYSFNDISPSRFLSAAPKKPRVPLGLPRK